MGVDVIVSQHSHGASQEGTPAVMCDGEGQGRTSGQVEHEAWPQVPLCASQNNTVFRLPKPDSVIYKMGTLRAREVKQLLQGHTASSTQNQQ